MSTESPRIVPYEDEAEAELCPDCRPLEAITDAVNDVLELIPELDGEAVSCLHHCFCMLTILLRNEGQVARTAAALDHLAEQFYPWAERWLRGEQPVIPG